MPFSYAQYAGNGSTTTFSVPFPYLLKAHVKLYTGFNILSGAYTSLLVDGVDYTWSSTTQVQTTVAPANGVTLTVLRDTPDSSQLVPWQDGSNLVADDMNIADQQNLYVVQEQQDRNDAGITQSTAAATAATAATTAASTATSTANTALSTANAATSTANTALSAANTASSNASAAVSTANTASSNASTAVTTANAASATAGTASTNASNAVTTANSAAANAATALSTANTALSDSSAAVSTANAASSNAAAAVSTANTANTNASNAVTTANAASTNASAAVSTANTASTNASNAVTTANAADTKADQAIAAVSSSINYQLKANVAAIPASPANDTYIEIQDSTGLESYTPLAGMPGGFVGDSGLSVRLRYTSAGTTWNWLNYYANNADGRYLKQSGGTLTGQLKADDSTSAATPGYAFDGDPNTGIGRPGADELALITGGSARLTVDSAGNIAVAAGLSQGGNAVVTTNDSRLTDARTPADGTVTDAKVASGAAIDKTKIGGTAITAADTGTVTSTMIADGTIQNADINAAAAIDKTKISGTAITAADTGTVTSTMIADGQITSAKIADATIVNQDVSLSAAIAGTKVSPDFGSQNVTTTGTVTGASLSPASSSAPANGVYLPAANTLGVATNGTGRLFINSSGSVGIGTSSPGASLHVAGAITSTPTGSGLLAGINSNYGQAKLYGTTGGILDFGASGADANARLLVNNSDSALQFHTNNGSTLAARMTLDSTGRLGIGTTSPADKLHCDGTVRLGDSTWYHTIGAGTGNTELVITANAGQGNATSAANIVFRSSTSGGAITERARIDSSGRLLVGTSSTSANCRFVVQSESSDSSGSGIQILARGSSSPADGQGLGQLWFTDSNHGEAASIRAARDGGTWNTSTSRPTRLVFSTTADGASSPTERMRIGNAGNIDTYDTNGAGFQSRSSKAAGVGDNTFAGYYGATNTLSGTASFAVRTNGNVVNTNNSYGSLSDIKLKENIVDANSQWDDLKALRVRNYNLKEGQTHTQIGLIAQEAELVSPGLISESPDRDEEGNDLGTVTKSVNYSVLYMKAVKALQEAMERIEQLETEMAEVKAQLS